MTQSVLVDRQDHILTITLNDPEARNPITGEQTITEIVEALATANDQVDVRCVVLTGRGKAFSGGGNIKDIRAGRLPFGGPPIASAEGYRTGVQSLAKALRFCEVPTIAAINGPAVGAGFDITMMCDLRIASTNATFAESFVRLGLVPGDGGAWLLPRTIGAHRAAQMLFTGETVTAEQALAWGLVGDIVEPDDLLPTVMDLAAKIAQNPPRAVRMAKRLLREGERQTFDSALETAALAQAIAHSTSDHRAAVASTESTYVGE